MNKKMIVLLGLMPALLFAVACGGTETIVETVEVEKIVVQEKEVVKEVPVEVVVEKEVIKERIVEVEAEKAPIVAAKEADTSNISVPTSKQSGGVVHFGTKSVGPAPGLNRAQSPEMLMWMSVSELLFRPGAPGSAEAKELVKPWLAKSWEMSDDFMTATVKIQDGVPFHGGNGTLSACDIAWSLNDTNGKTTPTSIHGQAGDFAAFMDEAECTDDSTLVLNFSAVESRWQTMLFNGGGDGFNVFSEKLYKEKGEDWMRENIVSTGPFSVGKWLVNDRAELNAVKDHWLNPPKIEKLVMVAVPEGSTRKAMMSTGELDIADLDLRDTIPLLKAGFGQSSGQRQSGVTLHLAGNYWEEKHAQTGEVYAHPTMIHDIPWIGNPFKPSDGNNPEGMNDQDQARMVRNAIARSYDRDLLNEVIMGGFGNPYYVNGFFADDPNWDDKYVYEYDPVVAEAMLDKAGYPRGKDGYRFEMPLYGFTTTALFEETADALSGFFEEVGIKTSVVKAAYAIARPSMVGRTNTTPTIQWCRSGLKVPYDWPRMEEETTLTRGGFGCHMENPMVLKTFQFVSAEADPAKRLDANLELLDYMHTEALAPGVVTKKFVQVFNPTYVKDWPQYVAVQAFYTGWELIELK